MESNPQPVMSPPYSDNTPKSNSMATTSLVLGITGLPFLCISFVLTFCGCLSGLLAIGAIVTGFLARQQIKSTGEQGDGMALTGIILGIVQVVIVTGAILISLVILAISLISAAASN